MDLGYTKDTKDLLRGQKIFYRICIAILSVFLFISGSSYAETIGLLIDVSSVNSPILKIEIPKGSKIYSANSKVGKPSVLTLLTKENIESFTVEWPKPQLLHVFDKEIEGYTDTILVPLNIKRKDASKSMELEIKADVLLCSNLCIPVSKTIKFALPPVSGVSTLNDSLIKILMLAFLGGMLLNFMPCVLPVLSIKIASITDGSRKKSFLASALGMLSTFVVGAILVSSLKMLGHKIGWGFHFQSPFFLSLMALVVTLFACGSFDIINIKVPLSGKIGSSGTLSAFSSGVLATLLATPCTGPFIGTTASIALEKSIWEIFLIFTTMGFGFASPFMVAAFVPGIPLPKPGSWMVKFKKLLSLTIFATAVWLYVLLCQHLTVIAQLSVGISLALLPIVLSSLNNGVKPVLLILVSIIAFSTYKGQISSLDARSNSLPEGWVSFDESKIQNLVNDGKVVFVEITADWCVTCHYNESFIIESDVVKKELHNAVKMRGDLTQDNPVIWDYIRRHGRSGVPFVIIYSKNNPNGIVMPEILTKEDLLRELKESGI